MSSIKLFPRRTRRRPGAWHTVPRSLAQISASLGDLVTELRMNRAEEWALPRILDRRLSEIADELRLNREAIEAFDKRWEPILEGGQHLVSGLRKRQEMPPGSRG